MPFQALPRYLGALPACLALAACATSPASDGGGKEVPPDWPEPLHREAPEYPRQAALSGVQGCVVVAFDVRRDGLTDNFEVLDAKPPGVFVESALLALRDWRYPERDEPIRLQQTIDFTLLGNRRVPKAECDAETGAPESYFVESAGGDP